MPEALLNNLYIFVLAMFTGFEVITKVPPLLHTPLMSGSNAISGISVVGALIITAEVAGASDLILVLGVVAVAMGMINVAGGFLVTDRMLEMFKKKPAAGDEK
ncbi:MAG: NAD(P) transhydrogenase subunit alpha [Gemmatimonadales bacterium]|jgi:NAD(P) transhydrogenase subunit alpha